MFKISKLSLLGYNDGEHYEYTFSSGINYFIGKNDTGKTEFYHFIDFMLGSSIDLSKRLWYENTLRSAMMEIQVDSINYYLERYISEKKNYLYSDDERKENLELNQYCTKLNSIFARNQDALREMRQFTNEDLTFRTFTMFNFLSEDRQGTVANFLDKCEEVKYQVKLYPVLNYIFNDNLEKIHDLQIDLKNSQEKLSELEYTNSRYQFILSAVNKNLQILDTSMVYTGDNAQEVKRKIDEIKDMVTSQKKSSKKPINVSELVVMYNSISEQIKQYESTIEDAKQFESAGKNREKLLLKLNEIVLDNSDLSYLVQPIQTLLKEVQTIISFSQYTTTDKTILELKKQRDRIKSEIKRSDSRFRCYDVDEKTKAITLIEAYLSENTKNKDEEIIRLRKKIRAIKEELRILQNNNDVKKIKNLSKFITDLYITAQSTSTIVNEDIRQNGFKIQYVKNGNSLLTTRNESYEDEETGEKKVEIVEYSVGSMARHSLIKLCGYLGFLELLIPGDKYPIIPILVIDHISKPFDNSNEKAIGAILKKAYETIKKDELQIFMFDHKDSDVLAIKPDNKVNLVNDNKSGFNPFYNPTKAQEGREIEK